MATKKTTTEKVRRCVGCGKPLQPGQSFMRTMKFTATKSGAMKQTVWGEFHLACHARALPRKEDFLQVLDETG